MAKNIDIVVRAKDATANAWKSVNAKAKKLGKSLKKGLSNTADFAKKAAAGIAIVGAAAVAAASKAIDAYKAQAESEAKLEATLRATGFAAGKTASELKKQASALQDITGIGDEVIISTQGIIATFKNVKGDEFDRATMAVLDMSAVMKKAGADTAAVENASIQVGKALNDPIRGISALSRVGVTFTDQQREQIRVMQEAGNVAGAQAIILAELEGEFGGTAAAMGKASHGVDQMNASFGDAIETIGKTIVETDGFDGIIAKVTASLKSLTEDGHIELWAENVRAAIKFIAPAISGIGKAFGAVKTKIQESYAFVGALTAGSSIKEAMEIAKATPEELKRDNQARLDAIQKEKAAKAAAREAEEQAEMAAAQAKAKATEAAKKQAAAEKTVISAVKDVAKEQEKAAKQAERRANAAKQLADVRKRLADIAKQDELADKEKKAQAAAEAVAKIKEKIGKIADTKEQRREDELRARDEKRDARRLEQLRAKLKRRVKLSADDAAFVRRADLVAQLGDAENAEADAKENAKQMRDTIAKKQRDDMVASLKRQETLLENNLKAAN